MRFLGWGIGHLNLPDFPHEANELIALDEDKVLGNVTGLEKGHTDGLDVGLEGAGGEGSDDDSVDGGDQDAEIEYEYEL